MLLLLLGGTSLFLYAFTFAESIAVSIDLLIQTVVSQFVMFLMANVYPLVMEDVGRTDFTRLTVTIP